MHNPTGRRARARLEAHRRMTPGGDLDQLTREVLAEMNAADDDHAIDELIAQAPEMTEAQAGRMLAITDAAREQARREGRRQ